MGREIAYEGGAKYVFLVGNEAAPRYRSRAYMGVAKYLPYSLLEVCTVVRITSTTASIKKIELHQRATTVKN